MPVHPSGCEAWVSASDIGAYAFCARSYALGKVQKVYPGKKGEERFRRGTSEHGRHGRRYALQRALSRAGYMLLVAATLAALLWFASGCSTPIPPESIQPWWGAGAALLIAVLLLAVSAQLRQQTGLAGGGRVLASDTGRGGVKRLRDPGTCLSGRPDYLLEERRRLRRRVVPVEVKPTRRGTMLHESDEMQLVAYLLLTAAEYGKRAASYGYVRYQSQTFRVQLTRDRKRRCLELRNGVVATRSRGDAERSHREPGRCARCSFRDVCGQNLV